MDAITIFSAIFKYGMWALAAVAVLAAVYAAAYTGYRKVLHGTKSLSLRQGFVLILLFAWFIVVLGLTALSRGANYTGSVNLSLISGYVSAWNQWSYSELQLIIFNMLMFAPLGFLLPFLTERGKKFPLACLISLGVTFFIEMLQLATGRGIFELDDLLHNFIGSIFGYFVAMFFLDCANNRKIRVKPFFCMLVIPLIFTIGIFSAVLVYHNQKYGNWAFVPAEKQDLSIVSIESSLDLSDEPARMPIYRNGYANNFEYAKQISEKFADFSQTELRKAIRSEGDSKIFETADGAQITYFSSEGYWSYINWNDTVSFDADAAENNREKIETWLTENGLFPENARFSVQNDTMLRWDVEPDRTESGDADYMSGLIMAQLDEKNEIAVFDYLITHNEYVGTEEIVSPQKAYGQVLEGNFEQYIPFEAGDRLCITECSLEYAYDTKGYCRPVYRFGGYINEKDFAWECLIPAME